jgi:hypothetical protein
MKYFSLMPILLFCFHSLLDFKRPIWISSNIPKEFVCPFLSTYATSHALTISTQEMQVRWQQIQKCGKPLCEIMQSSRSSCNTATSQYATAPACWNPQAVPQFPEKKWIATPTVGKLSAFTVSLKECDHLHTDMKLYTILQLLISITQTKGK